jgi:hypothetical protein
MVSNAFAARGIHLHYDIKNVVPVQACTDNPTATPPEYCSFPGEAGVVGWKGDFQFLKIQPLNYPDEASCKQALNGPCIRRFQPGRKDSYHYVLFGASVGNPNWSFQDGTLISIASSGSGNSSATFTTSREHGLGVGGRVTISDAITNPNLSGVYFVQNLTDTSFTIQLANPTGCGICLHQGYRPRSLRCIKYREHRIRDVRHRRRRLAYHIGKVGGPTVKRLKCRPAHSCMSWDIRWR